MIYLKIYFVDETGYSFFMSISNKIILHVEGNPNRGPIKIIINHIACLFQNKRESRELGATTRQRHRPLYLSVSCRGT
jgi:hypothetical protein